MGCSLWRSCAAQLRRSYLAPSRLATSPLESASDCYAFGDGRPLHDDEAGAVQMFNETLRHDLRHNFVRVVDAPTAPKAQRERQR